MSEHKKKKKLKLNTKGFSQAGLAQGLALKRPSKYVVSEQWKITDKATGKVKRIKIKPLKQARVKKNTF